MSLKTCFTEGHEHFLSNLEAVMGIAHETVEFNRQVAVYMADQHLNEVFEDVSWLVDVLTQGKLNADYERLSEMVMKLSFEGLPVELARLQTLLNEVIIPTRDARSH